MTGGRRKPQKGPNRGGQQARRRTAGSRQTGAEPRGPRKPPTTTTSKPGSAGQSPRRSTAAGRRPQPSQLNRSAVRRVPQNLRRDSASPAQILAIAAGVCVAFGALYAIAWMAAQGPGAPPTSQRHRSELAGWDSQANPKRPGHRRLRKQASADKTDQEQQAKVNQLEQEMLRIDRDANRKGPRRYNHLIERWQAFAEKAKGLSLYDYAVAMIEELEAEKATTADGAIDKVLQVSWPLARSGYWIEAFGHVDRFIRRFEGTPAATLMVREREQMVADKKLAESATFRVICDFSGKQPKLQGVQIVKAQQVGKATPDEQHIRFLRNYSSFMVFQFQVSSLPEKVWLRVGHLMSWTEAGPHSPITIVINDKVLVGDWSPFHLNFYTSSWEIRRYLRPGVNTISWQLGEARTQYWLRRWEISDWQG